MLDFHPFVVHFAVALLLVSVLFDILSVSTQREHLQMVGWWNLFLGFLAALFAVITGLYAKNSAFFPDSATGLILYHQYTAFGTLAIFTILFIWRSSTNRVISPRWRNYYLTLAVTGAILLLATGFLGGQMVFEHGTNVEPVRELQQTIDSLRTQSSGTNQQ